MARDGEDTAAGRINGGFVMMEYVSMILLNVLRRVCNRKGLTTEKQV